MYAPSIADAHTPPLPPELIRNMLEKLEKHRCFEVERLLTNEEANKAGRKPPTTKKEEMENLSASNRLTYLGNHWEEFTETRIILTTPELVSSPAALQSLEKLSKLGILKRVVLDEFDIVLECSSKYREAYVELLPKLRERCQQSKFMFLSATISDDSLRTLLQETEAEAQRHKVFIHHRALADSLAFSVERKQSLKQVHCNSKPI